MLAIINKKPKVVEPQASMMPKESGVQGGTMMGMQQAPAAFQAQPLQNAQVMGRATYTKQQLNNNRGNDFKKTA